MSVDAGDADVELLGRVTDEGILRARWHGEEVCTLPVAALTQAAPVYRRPAEEPCPGRGSQASLGVGQIDSRASYGSRTGRVGTAG